jgi:hypothetical protein
MRLADIPSDAAYTMNASGGFQSEGKRVPRLLAGAAIRLERLASAASTARTIAPRSTPSASID